MDNSEGFKILFICICIEYFLFRIILREVANYVCTTILQAPVSPI